MVVLSVGGVSLYMALFEDRFIYFPGKEISQTPAAIGLTFSEHQFTSADSLILHGWYMPHPSARFTLLHLHGNAGNISHRLSLYRRWHSLGLSVFAFDYRGYGKSAGEATEAGLYEDAKSARAYVMQNLGVSASRLIISGRSLGAAVAVKLATEQGSAGVVLETPFTNISDMAAYHYPWLPLRWLARSSFDTATMMRDLHAPLLLISAITDRIAPASMADHIFTVASQPKRHIRLAGGHNDFDHLSERQYLNAWKNWLLTLH